MSFYLKETTTNSYIQFVSNQYSYISNPNKKHLFKDIDKAANIVLNHSIVDKFLSNRVFSIYHAETNSLVYDQLVSDVANKGLICLNISKAVLNMQESLSEAPVTSGNPIEMQFKDSLLPFVPHTNCAKAMIDGDELPVKDSLKKYQASKYTKDKILPTLESMSSTFEEIASSINSLPSNEDLAKQLGDYNAQIVDVLHYIEFSHLDACNGYLIFKKLQDILIARRTVKEQMEVINKLENCNLIIEKINAANAQAKKSVEESRSYCPRSDIDIFD